MDCFQAPFAIWITDKNFDVIESNPAAIYLGNSPFSGLSILNTTKLKYLGQSLDKSELCLEWEKTGKTRWLNWRVWQHGDFVYFSADDVTSLKNNELYLRQILDAIPDMILVKEEGSRIRWANKAFQQYYCMSNEELQKIIDAPFQAQDNTRQYILDDNWVWNNKRPLRIDREPVNRFDGVVRLFQTMKSPIMDQEDNVQMTVGISRDITDQIAFEEKSYAASKMASLGEMAGGIAHEINNPIGVILGKVHQMKRRVESPVTHEDLNIIDRNAERIVKIVEGLRNFCQEDNKQTMTDFSIRDLVDETLTYCDGRIRGTNINLIQNIDESIMIHGKRIQISQVLLNLLNNAIDAIPQRPGQWIKISGIKSKETIELRVEDSGPGVPIELEAKVMQPFFTTKEIGKGIGLGLSISFAISKQHGGELLIDRKTSPSCFLLRLPIN